MSIDDYWDGATYVEVITITNESTQGASDIELILSPGEGNEFEVLYGWVINGDTLTRTTSGFVDDGANTITRILPAIGIAAGADIPFPVIDEAAALGAAFSNKWIVSGAMRLRLQVAAVADGQDATFAVALRIRGGIPTRTTVGAGTEAVTVTTARVF